MWCPVTPEADVPDDADWDFAPGGVDLIVLGERWAEAMARQGPPVRFGQATVHAVDAVALVLLKLYAGGPRDAWDIHALLESLEDPKDLSVEIDRQSAALPSRAKALWRRIRDGG